MPVILTTPQDYQKVRDYLGVTIKDLDDTAIQDAFLEDAEVRITKALESQSGSGTTVPTVAQILAITSPAIAADLVFLQAAVKCRIAYLFATSAVNAVDTSVTVGDETKDLGGIGAQWKEQREEYLKDCDEALGNIHGFKRWRTL